MPWWKLRIEAPQPTTGDKIDLSTKPKEVLSITGVWTTEKKGFIYYAHVIGWFAVGNYVLAGCIGYIYYYLQRSKFKYNDLSDTIAVVFTFVWYAYSTTCHVRNQHRYRAILKELGDFSVYEKPTNVEKVDKVLNMASKFFIYYIIINLTIVTIYNVLKSCEDDIVDDCGYIVFSWYPYVNLYRAPMRQLGSVLQVLSISTCVFNGFFGPWLILVIHEYIVNRIQHLKILIREIPTLEGRPARKAQIKKCLQYHYKILELAEDVMDASYSFLFFHVPFTSCIMTMVLYGLLLVKFQPIMAAYFLLWYSYIAITCAAGERLLGNSEDIAEVAYHSIPFDGDVQTQRDLLMIIIRSSRPLYLSAGLLGNCSFMLLMSIMKTSYSLMTLLADST